MAHSTATYKHGRKHEKRRYRLFIEGCSDLDQLATLAAAACAHLNQMRQQRTSLDKTNVGSQKLQAVVRLLCFSVGPDSGPEKMVLKAPLSVYIYIYTYIYLCMYEHMEPYPHIYIYIYVLLCSISGCFFFSLRVQKCFFFLFQMQPLKTKKTCFPPVKPLHPNQTGSQKTDLRLVLQCVQKRGARAAQHGHPILERFEAPILVAFFMLSSPVLKTLKKRAIV